MSFLYQGLLKWAGEFPFGHNSCRLLVRNKTSYAAIILYRRQEGKRWRLLSLRNLKKWCGAAIMKG